MNTGRTDSRIAMLNMTVAFLLSMVGMNTAYAQQAISGKVVSRTDRSPVAGAFVYAYSDKTMTGYALSDGEGLFSVRIPSGKSADRLTVTCLGYSSETIAVDGKTSSYTVFMTENHISIKESKVTASVVEEKGDTLSYTAGAFADGTERVLGDLLAKIPGLTVSQSGGVLVNGNYINKFYVEGMDMMGAGYGVVTKNLSPDKIARIEVYKRHQPIRSLVGIQQTDKSAVNIILKEDARNTWMITGDFIGGAPDLPLFDAKALLTRFSKNSQDLYLIKGNNIGGDIIKELTLQQYMGRTGAFLISEDNLDSDFASRLNPRRSSLPLPQEYWYDNLSGIASFNHLSKIDEDRQLRFSIQGAAEKYGESTMLTERIDFSSEESMTIEETESVSDTKYYVTGKLGYENNSSKRFFKNELSFSGQIRDNEGMGDVYSQRYALPSFKAENSLETTLRASERHALSISSISRFISNSHSADFRTDALSAHQDYDQRSVISNNSISSSVLVNGIKLNLRGGLELEYQGIESRLQGIDMSDIVFSSSPDIFRISPNLSLSSSFLIGKTDVTISAPVSYSFVSCSTSTKTLMYPTLSPSISLRRTLSQNLKAGAYASYSVSRNDIESLLASAVMSSYRSISYSDSLARRQGARASISLDWEDNVNMFYAGVTGSAFMTGSNRMSSSFYSKDFTLTGFTDGSSRNDGYGLTGNMSKFFGVRSFVIDLKGGWNRTNQDLQLQNLVRSYTADQWNASIQVRTNPVGWLSAEMKAEYMHNAINGDSKSSSDRIDLYGMVSVKPYKALSIDTYADYIHEYVPGMNVTNTPLVKTVATWRFNKFSIVGECRNILGCKEFTREYVNTFQTMSSTTRLMGRQFLLGIRMSL